MPSAALSLITMSVKLGAEVEVTLHTSRTK